MTKKNDSWLYEITPHKKLIDLNLKEIWRYRDLLLLFVKVTFIPLPRGYGIFRELSLLFY